MPGIKWSAAHNSFVEVGAELGIPGLGLFATMVVGSLLQAVRLRKKIAHWQQGDGEQQFIYYAALYMPVAFLGFAVGGFFVSFAYLDPIYVLVALLGGLQLSYEARLRSDRALPAGGVAMQIPDVVPVVRRGGRVQGPGLAPPPPPPLRPGPGVRPG
jgi:O-antigen ligase